MANIYKASIDIDLDKICKGDDGNYFKGIAEIKIPGYNKELVGISIPLTPEPQPEKFPGGIQSWVYPPKSGKNVKYSIVISKIGNDIYIGTIGSEYRGVVWTGRPFIPCTNNSRGLNEFLDFIGYSREERREIFKTILGNSTEEPKRPPMVFETSTSLFPYLRFEEVEYTEEFCKKWQPKIPDWRCNNLRSGRRGVMLTFKSLDSTGHYFSICNPCDTFDFRKGIEAAMLTNLGTTSSISFCSKTSSTFAEVMRKYDSFVKSGNGGSGK